MGFAGVDAKVTLKHIYNIYRDRFMSPLVLGGFRGHITQVSE